MPQAETYMQRCFQLATLGEGRVSPNPLVGAVLVHEGRIIGEGWHQQYGGPHAEVNCIASVAAEDVDLIPNATLYCNLEPCAHHGKTPPCADLIIRRHIPRVVIANTDPNPLVAGQGIARMRAQGILVETGILEAAGAWLNRSFFTAITQKRPFIILKWAQSADGFIGKTGERTAITGPLTQRLVHRWRAAADAMLVGGRTALVDNPRLDVRHYEGKNPLRVVWGERNLPAGHALLGSEPETLFWSGGKPLEALLEQLYTQRCHILLVEGGATTLQRFIEKGLYDELRVLESDQCIGGDIPAPQVPKGLKRVDEYMIGNDRIRIFAPDDEKHKTRT